jgi:LysM repeat protein
VNDNVTRCLVCGTSLTGGTAAKSTKPIQGARMPEITLSLPVALGLIVLVLAIGAAVVFGVLQGTGQVVEPTATATITPTATITLTSQPTPTQTLAPTMTPLPPTEYIVKSGDLCGSIAFLYNVSVNAIVLANNLPADCSTLVEGQKLLIPQPTPTASPQPTATLSAAEATESACEKVDYTIQSNDTLSSIAATYKVTVQSIKDFNGLTSDNVIAGTPLRIPLCQRTASGATPTPTAPPPYPAPNLLLPADGTSFTVANETITLQWASVGDLRQNETYAVTVEDVTEGNSRKVTEYTTDTKFILPVEFRPSGTTPHIIRWSVVPVRQTGSNDDGQPIYEPAGTTSLQRVFSWWGSTVNTPTP